MIFDLQNTDDHRDIIHRTVQAIAEGQVVGLPTETLYGVAANALDGDAVERLCELKGRDANAPLAISVRSAQAAGDFFGDLSPLARRLTKRLWPGPLTVVVDCDLEKSAVSQLPGSVRDRIVGADGGVGFRVVDHPIMAHLHRYLSGPLVLTSANLSGNPSPTTAAEVVRDFGDRLPILLDDGPTRLSGGSTVVRVQGNHWRLLREGVVERAAMRQAVKPLVAIVCTGNTCRSPMGEALLREIFRDRLGCEDTVRVVSAGIAASRGSAAAPQAAEVMGERELDLTGHSSSPLDDAILETADLVLTMTTSHRAAILAGWPDLAERVHTLRRDGGDITDPIGMPVETYRQCADQMNRELAGWVDSLDANFYPREADSAATDENA